LLLGHASIQTTERYLGTEQNLDFAVNDALGLDRAARAGGMPMPAGGRPSNKRGQNWLPATEDINLEWLVKGEGTNERFGYEGGTGAAAGGE
jgi:hypothetical protein